MGKNVREGTEGDRNSCYDWIRGTALKVQWLLCQCENGGRPLLYLEGGSSKLFGNISTYITNGFTFQNKVILILPNVRMSNVCS